MKVTLLTEEELRRAVGLDEEALAAVADGFSALSAGGVQQPPILRVEVPEHNGEVDVKSAYVPGLDSFAVKMSSGFFDNPARGLPSGSGLMVVLSASTGVPQAVLLDNGYLTDLRTALAGAVAAKHLAPAQVTTVGVLGVGSQARFQLEALKLVRPFSRVSAWGRHAGRARRYAEEMGPRLGVEVTLAQSPEEVVRQSELVVSTTPATSPLFDPEALHPGLHLTAMGSDAEGKNELAPEVLGSADLVVCDARAQCLRLGELGHAVRAGALDEAAVVELGELTAGSLKWQRDERAVTVCDLTGTGVQDTAIARLALARARTLGLGVSFGA